MSTLESLEAHLKSLLEDRILNLIPGRKPEDQITLKLASVMFAQIRIQKDKSILAPNIYMIVANPSNLSRWEQEPGFLDDLAIALESAGHEAGFEFSSKPSITTSPDESMAENDLRIYASFTLPDVSETRGMQMKNGNKTADKPKLKNSFLILHGSEIISIDQPVINLGRRLDNHVVIDDPRVSRNHAQIRESKDHYVIFDLNSTGGTFVNGDRIHQSILYPGDVISLSGVTMIFGQDLASTQPKEQSTQPNSVKLSEQKTELIPKDKNTPE